MVLQVSSPTISNNIWEDIDVSFYLWHRCVIDLLVNQQFCSASSFPPSLIKSCSHCLKNLTFTPCKCPWSSLLKLSFCPLCCPCLSPCVSALFAHHCTPSISALAVRICTLYISLKHPRTTTPLLAEEHIRLFAWVLTPVSSEGSGGCCWMIGGLEKKSIVPASWQTLYRLLCLRTESVGFPKHSRRRKRVTHLGFRSTSWSLTVITIYKHQFCH